MKERGNTFYKQSNNIDKNEVILEGLVIYMKNYFHTLSIGNLAIKIKKSTLLNITEIIKMSISNSNVFTINYISV